MASHPGGLSGKERDAGSKTMQGAALGTGAEQGPERSVGSPLLRFREGSGPGSTAEKSSKMSPWKSELLEAHQSASLMISQYKPGGNHSPQQLSSKTDALSPHAL